MRLPRFTVRWLMVAVAIVGVLVGGWIEGERRRERFERLRMHYHELASISVTVVNPGDVADPKELEDVKRFRFLESKYRRAARYPWFPVNSDPPEPE